MGADKGLLHDFMSLNVQTNEWTFFESKKKIRHALKKSFTRKFASEHIHYEEPDENDFSALKRSNHTMVTVYQGHTKTKEGNLLHEFCHYLFGGLAEQPYQVKEKD